MREPESSKMIQREREAFHVHTCLLYSLHTCKIVYRMGGRAVHKWVLNMSERNMSVRGQCENKTQLRWYVTRIADGNLVYAYKMLSNNFSFFLSGCCCYCCRCCYISASNGPRKKTALFIHFIFLLSVDPNIGANSHAISLPCVVNKSKLICFKQNLPFAFALSISIILFCSIC